MSRVSNRGLNQLGPPPRVLTATRNVTKDSFHRRDIIRSLWGERKKQYEKRCETWSERYPEATKRKLIRDLLFTQDHAAARAQRQGNISLPKLKCLEGVQ